MTLIAGQLLISIIYLVKSDLLRCHVCNSNYLKCGNGINFDSSVQSSFPCYDQCIKIVVYPGGIYIYYFSQYFLAM